MKGKEVKAIDSLKDNLYSQLASIDKLRLLKNTVSWSEQEGVLITYEAAELIILMINTKLPVLIREKGAEPDGWISVRDRLPELGDEVNVFTKNGLITSLSRFTTYEGSNGYYWDNHYGRGNFYSSQSIIHWQPVPSPPKE